MERKNNMEYKLREYPLFAACGLNCGLCPRFYTDGDSRCPGCAGEGFSAVHPPCGVLSCCQRKNIEYCFLCEEYPCKKLDGADLTDSFITHKNQFRDLEKAKLIGMKAYKAELDEKVDVLKTLLSKYNDGRKKSFFCTAVNLLELQDIRVIMEEVAENIQPDSSVKEKAATVSELFEKMAEKRGISLKMRRSSKKFIKKILTLRHRGTKEGN
jgi:hypothetical protein